MRVRLFFGEEMMRTIRQFDHETSFRTPSGTFSKRKDARFLLLLARELLLSHLLWRKKFLVEVMAMAMKWVAVAALLGLGIRGAFAAPAPTEKAKPAEQWEYCELLEDVAAQGPPGGQM